MTAGKDDYTIEQGTRFRLKFRWTDEAGNPILLNQASARMQIRKTKTTTSKLYANLTEFLTVEAADGSVFLEIPGDKTMVYTFDTGRFSLRVDRPGDQKRLVEGVVNIARETTE